MSEIMSEIKIIEGSLKGVTHYTLRGKECENNVGAFIERPRATTGRPYKFVFMVSKTCFMEGTPWVSFFCMLVFSII